ncbi:hypothetical protein GCM10010842_39850 [Deinococcus daejeonensis]|uniref:Uncharacterized protein n=1 Tax=Deinococcus daejeonensis TaxID=1007098 RepID=A0ABQ2JKV6_9DEIO|nr:hypothetical protein GCM10010842_39850 [Deinococcus daejeonensis]
MEVSLPGDRAEQVGQVLLAEQAGPGVLAEQVAKGGHTPTLWTRGWFSGMTGELQPFFMDGCPHPGPSGHLNSGRLS